MTKRSSLRLGPAVAGIRRGRRELTQKTGNKIIEPFRFFRVFRGQKRFVYPRNTLKDAKISKTKIGLSVFPRHDQVFAVANAQTRRPCRPSLLVRNVEPYAAGNRTTFFLAVMASAPFAAGKKVSSTYFLALATRSRLQLRSSFLLIFSRWLSIVLTLRLSE